MKKILATIALCCLIFTGNAQPYDQSLGVSVGFMNGISYKGFLGSNLALQADATYSFRTDLGNGFHLNPNLMYQNSIASTPLEWFAGGGISFGSAHSNFLMGLNAIGGIEYAFDIPLVIGTDIRLGPGFEFRNNVKGGFLASWNISVRYIIK